MNFAIGENGDDIECRPTSKASKAAKRFQTFRILEDVDEVILQT